MEKEWYVVRVQSGREDTIKDNLERRVKLTGMDKFISRILVPSERVSEMKGGKTRVSKRKMYPGYILVEMEPNDEAWFAIRETPGIGDFIGAHGRQCAAMLANGSPNRVNDHNFRHIVFLWCRWTQNNVFSKTLLSPS